MARIFAVPRADALTEAEYAAFRALATPARAEKAGRFLRREDACRALVAEALLRHAAREAGSRFDGTALRHNPQGKPFLPGAGFEFNLAHSGEWVLCGIDDGEIGVDIERHHRVDSGIARRFFSGPENSLLAQAGEEAQRLRSFFDIWSLKESYVKAIGKGLSCPLDGFACLPSAAGEIGFLPLDDALPRRHFQLIAVRSGYSCAVCSVERKPALVPSLLDPADLLSALGT